MYLVTFRRRRWRRELRGAGDAHQRKPAATATSAAAAVACVVTSSASEAAILSADAQFDPNFPSASSVDVNFLSNAAVEETAAAEEPAAGSAGAGFGPTGGVSLSPPPAGSRDGPAGSTCKEPDWEPIGRALYAGNDAARVALLSLRCSGTNPFALKGAFQCYLASGASDMMALVGGGGAAAASERVAALQVFIKNIRTAPPDMDSGVASAVSGVDLELVSAAGKLLSKHWTKAGHMLQKIIASDDGGGDAGGGDAGESLLDDLASLAYAHMFFVHYLSELALRRRREKSSLFNLCFEAPHHSYERGLFLAARVAVAVNVARAESTAATPYFQLERQDVSLLKRCVDGALMGCSTVTAAAADASRRPRGDQKRLGGILAALAFIRRDAALRVPLPALPCILRGST